MLTGRVVGAVEVQARLGRRIPAAIRANVSAAVRRLGLSLERKIKLEKLEGQVLHRRTGRLVRSVNTRFTDGGSRFESSTGTALSYGRAWVLGFDVPERTIVARKAKALYWPGAKHPVRSVHQKARHQAARDWLRPALREMKPQIRAELKEALRGIGGR